MMNEQGSSPQAGFAKLVDQGRKEFSDSASCETHDRAR